MTEREAEALATRLQRIWGGQKAFGIDAEDHEVTLDEDYFFHTYIQQNIFVEVLKSGEVFLNVAGQDDYAVSFYAHPGGVIKNLEETNDFSVQWMLFFRHGCFLMGLPIEATAYEKAEWMQGFSPELESWNLRM